MKMSVNQMVKMAVLSAMSIVLMYYVRFPIIPSASFLEYEPADVPVLITSFLYGPLAGFIVTIVVSLIQAMTVSAKSGWVGLVMHIIATGTLVIVAGLIYKKFHNFKGAIIALVAGSLCMTLVMIPSNLFFTVNFYGYPKEAVMALLPTAIVPFNLIKAGINSVLVMLLYKSIHRVFDRFR